MKIAITADPEIPVPPAIYGGIERVIYMLIIELQKSGHEVTLFAHKDSKVPCRLIAYPSTGNKITDIIKNSWLILKNVLIIKFDIIHSFGRLAYLLPVMPFKIPVLMSYQREPTISQIKKTVQISKTGTIAFTGCSNYITNKIKPFAIAITVYNCVDFNKYTATANVQTDAPLIFLGRIEHIKGVHSAIEIANKANKLLVIAGNIPAESLKYYNEKIKPALNDRIKYIGPVNDEQKNQLLQNGLALLMPIHWNEPFGIVMIEAMACGTPVLGFKKGAVAEVIENEKTGFIGTTDIDLVKYIGIVRNIDRTTIRKKAEERFSTKIIADQYINIYNKLIIKN